MGKSEGIKVMVRTRPFEGSHSTQSGGTTRLGINITPGASEEEWTVSTIKANVSKPSCLKSWGFNFIFWSGFNYKKFTFEHDEEDKQMIADMMENKDRIFCSQERVYELCGIPMRTDMQAGKPVIIFAFGLSGSGKTYTTFGLDKDDNPNSWFQMDGPEDPRAGSQWGLFPRLAYDFYQDKAANPAIKIKLVFMQNVVNEVFDLLGGGQDTISSMRTDKGGFCYHPSFVGGGFGEACPTFEKLCDVFRKAASSKQIAPTQFNPQSTRGHVVVVFVVVQPDGKEGRFYVCDLAGAEPAAEVQYYDYTYREDGEIESKRPKPGPQGAKLTKMLQTQGKKINLSLGELQQVFEKMKKQLIKHPNKAPKIVGVSSWIMKFLKTALPKSSVYLICAIRPECGFSPGDPGSSQPEWTQFERMTIQTLKFGKSASAIKTKAVSLTNKKISKKDLDAAKAAAEAAEEKAAALQAKIDELMSGGAAADPGAQAQALADARAAWEAEQETIDAGENAALAAAMQGETDAAKSELANMKAAEAAKKAQTAAVYAKRGLRFVGMLSTDDLAAVSTVPHFLHIDDDPFQSRRWIVELSEEKEFVVGRKKGDIKLFSTNVASHAHCKFTRSDNRTVSVAALEGATWVNGVKVTADTPCSLKANDRVSVGGEVLLFRLPGSIDEPFRVAGPDGVGDADGMVPYEEGAMEDGDMTYEAEEAQAKEKHMPAAFSSTVTPGASTPDSIDHDHLMAEVRAAYALTLEAQQICAELGRGHLSFEVAMTTNVHTHVPLAGITIKDPTSKLEVVMTTDEFVMAMSQVRDGHKLVMIHVDMGDDFVLGDEYDPAVAFFQRPTKIATAHAHWAALFYGMTLPDEGIEYEELNLKIPKIATDGQGGKLRYQWVLAEGTDEDKLLTDCDGIMPPSDAGGPAQSWLNKTWPFKLEILSAHSLPVMCREVWVEYEMKGEMVQSPARFAMDDPELHGAGTPTSSPVFSDETYKYVADFSAEDVDEDMADWLDKISDGKYGVPIVVMGLPFVNLPKDKITVVGGIFQHAATHAAYHDEATARQGRGARHEQSMHNIADHMPGGDLCTIQNELEVATKKYSALLAKEKKLEADFAAYKQTHTFEGTPPDGGCCTVS